MLITLDYVLSALKGTAATRRAYREVLAAGPSIASGIARLAEIRPADEAGDEERPIFVFSAGWRSGSTLLQRLLMSDPQVFLWGEAYDHCGLVQALAGTTRAFTTEWPPASYFYDGTPRHDLSSRWIADLYPALTDLRKAHRAFFIQLLAEPARRGGACRWGLKEVRLGVEHAMYLRWLFPKARFAFLYRHPLDAYRSYCRYQRSWYNAWPQDPVFTPTRFGQHWKVLVKAFLQAPETTGGLVLRYEDLLVGGAIVTEIERHFGLCIDPSVLDHKVGSSDREKGGPWVSRFERWLLRRSVNPIAGQLGYKM